MTAFFKKHRDWVSVIVLITAMSFSFTSKAQSDAEKDLGPPAGTAGYQQDEKLESPLVPPMGTRGHYRPEDSINVQSHPLSEPNRQDKKNRPKMELPRDNDKND